MGSRVTVCCAACGLTQEPAPTCLRCQALLPSPEGGDSASSATARIDLPAAAVIGGTYEIVRSIGAGGMGAVYLARDRSLNRNVAVKVMPRALMDDPELVERFRREARSAATLDHPNIIPIHVVGDHEGRPFFVMKFIDGQSLAEIVAREGFVQLERACQLIEGVLDGLQVIHEAGFVHRDVKLANIMIDRRGIPIILDFGILRDAHATNLTRSGLIPGTPQYMAPEQAKGIVAIDGRADIYSVGVVLYELLTGAPPFSGNSGIEVLMKHVGEPAEPPSTRNARLPAAVDGIVLKALAKSPGDRFATAAEFRDALIGLRADLVGRRVEGREAVGPIEGVPIEVVERAGGLSKRSASAGGSDGAVSGVGATVVAPSTSSVRATGILGEAMTRGGSRKARAVALVSVALVVVSVVTVVALQKSADRRGDGAAARAEVGADDKISTQRRKDAEALREEGTAFAPSRLGGLALNPESRTDAGSVKGAKAAVRVENMRRADSAPRTPEARARRAVARKGRVSIIVYDGDDPVDGAAVFVDGKPLRARKDVEIDVGQHKFTANAPGIGDGWIVKRILAGRNPDVEIHLTR